MTDPTSTTAIAPGAGAELFGHPRGLATLFFTEMWERFTYYGMRAILVLFLVGAVDGGGLGIDDKTGNAIYGLYISATYLLSLYGGWIADRLIGAQRAVWWGGILIMVGNGLLAVGSTQLFFLGLIVIVFGVGLLKPNISAIVAQIYPEGGSRRDAGFSIFYMGINVGAFLGSTIVPILAASYGWRAGFAAPAVGMLLGLVQFAMTRHYLGVAGVTPGASQIDTASNRRAWISLIVLTTALVGVCVAAILGLLHIDPVKLLGGRSGRWWCLPSATSPTCCS
jgi:POT family proton-dependent oligopeptide transporter